MKIKFIKATVVNGSVWPVDAVLEVEDKRAKELINEGAALELPATDTIPAVPHKRVKADGDK